MFCKNCGIQIDDDSKYCSSCGSKQSISLTDETISMQNSIQLDQAKIQSVNDYSSISIDKSFDITFNRNIGISIVGVFLLLLNLFLIFSLGVNKEDRIAIYLVIFLVRISAALSCSIRANKLNRENTSWTLFGFFSPAFALFIIGLLKKRLYPLKYSALSSKEKSILNNKIAFDLSKIEKYQNAIYFSERSIELDPFNHAAFDTRGYIRLKLGYYEAALNDFNKSIELEPNHAIKYFHRGFTSEKLGNIDSAIKDWETAYEMGFTEALIQLKRLNIIPDKVEEIRYERMESSSDNKLIDKTIETYKNLSENNLNNKSKIKPVRKTLIKISIFILLIFAFKFIFYKYDKSKIIKPNNSFENNVNYKSSSTIEVVYDSLKKYQTISFPGRFSITIPEDWEMDRSNSSSIYSFNAVKNGHFMSILEIDPLKIDVNFNAQSIWAIDKEKFLYEFRQKYSDFKLIDFQKIKINMVDAYFIKTSFSFFSFNKQSRISGINYQYILYNPKTNKIYSLEGSSKINEMQIYQNIYKKNFNTFKFL